MLREPRYVGYARVVGGDLQGRAAAAAAAGERLSPLGELVMLNAAQRNRRYRALRTLQLTKQITLNQRTPIPALSATACTRRDSFRWLSAALSMRSRREIANSVPRIGTTALNRVVTSRFFLSPLSLSFSPSPLSLSLHLPFELNRRNGRIVKSRGAKAYRVGERQRL